MEKIGVIGSGAVGQTLAKGFKQHGYDVRIASRTPAKLKDFSAESGIPAVTFAEAAAWGDVIVLAVHGAAAQEAARTAGAQNLSGKVVIDTTNPIKEAPPVDGVLQYFTGPNTSLLEELQRAFSQARFVKAFSSVGNTRMVNPTMSAKPTMFICGNDADAKKWVSALLETFGWEAADMGNAVAARAIEPLAMLWCIPGFQRNHWTHAFKVVWD